MASAGLSGIVMEQADNVAATVKFWQKRSTLAAIAQTDPCIFVERPGWKY